jgi:hypothetical protein
MSAALSNNLLLYVDDSGILVSGKKTEEILSYGMSLIRLVN